MLNYYIKCDAFRAQADKESVAAQRLWIACLSLRNSIELGNLSAADLETTMKPLVSEIKAIKVLFFYFSSNVIF